MNEADPIKFDIIYREKVESGEYKVYTRNGWFVKVVEWEADGDYPIIAYIPDGSKPQPMAYTVEGKIYPGSEHPSDLIMIPSPEPEFSDYELALVDICRKVLQYKEEFSWMNCDMIHRNAKNVLDLSQKEICKSIWKNSDHNQPDGERMVLTTLPNGGTPEVAKYSKVNPGRLWAYVDDLLKLNTDE